MVARTKRNFSVQNKTEFLKDLKICRDACIRACTTAPINGTEYKAADRLIGEIDNVAEALTGNRKYFFCDPHSVR
jgi:hypothetical protein